MHLYCFYRNGHSTSTLSWVANLLLACFAYFLSSKSDLDIIQDSKGTTNTKVLKIIILILIRHANILFSWYIVLMLWTIIMTREVFNFLTSIFFQSKTLNKSRKKRAMRFKKSIFFWNCNHIITNLYSFKLQMLRPLYSPEFIFG